MRAMVASRPTADRAPATCGVRAAMLAARLRPPGVAASGGLGAAEARAVVVECPVRDGALGGERCSERDKAPAGGVEFVLALPDQRRHGLVIAHASDHLCLGAGYGCDRLLLGARLVALGLEHVDLHFRERLALDQKVALIDHHRFHPPGELGGDIDLGGFDAAIAAYKSLARAGRFHRCPKK